MDNNIRIVTSCRSLTLYAWNSAFKLPRPRPVRGLWAKQWVGLVSLHWLITSDWKYVLYVTCNAGPPKSILIHSVLAANLKAPIMYGTTQHHNWVVIRFFFITTQRPIVQSVSNTMRKWTPARGGGEATSAHDWDSSNTKTVNNFLCSYSIATSLWALRRWKFIISAGFSVYVVGMSLSVTFMYI